MLPSEFLIGMFKSFLALFIIIDPFLGMVVFVTLTKGAEKGEKAKAALIATAVAGGLLALFLFTGMILLNIMGISLPSFVVAGGIILLILGVQAVFGIEFSKKENQDKKAAAVIIGTPLLSGPGAMTTIVILSQQYGYWPPLIALILVMAITWTMLYYSEKIASRMGDRLIEVLSRVLGLMLAALAAEFIKDGISDMIRGFKK
ncbi:MAG: MarC family protein [Candidatus Woesearchaeota archaeon]|jgi:multiple antibiotic resistance protein